MASKKKTIKKSSKKAAKADSRQTSKGSAKANPRKAKKAKKPLQAKRGGAAAKKRPAPAARRKASPPSRTKKAKAGTKAKPPKRKSEAARKRVTRRAASPIKKKKTAQRAASPPKKKAARRAAPSAKKKSASRRAAPPPKKKPAKRGAAALRSGRRIAPKKAARRAAPSPKKKAARRRIVKSAGARRSGAPPSKRLLLKKKLARRAPPPKRTAARRPILIVEAARAAAAKKARRLAAATKAPASVRPEKVTLLPPRKRDLREEKASKASVRPEALSEAPPPSSKSRKGAPGAGQEPRPTLKRTSGGQEPRVSSKKALRHDGDGPAPLAGRRRSTAPPRMISREPPRTPPQIVSFPIPAMAAVKRPSIEERSASIEVRLNAQSEEFRRRYIDSFDMSWIYHDSALEGVVYTFEELRAALSGQGMPVTDSSIQPTCDDIRRHKEAIDFVRDFATKKRLPVTVDIIKKIYLILRPEEGDVKTVKYRKDVPQHRLYFHEYAPPDKIAYKVRQIVDWLTDPETRKTRNGIRIAARAHYDLLRVFPFPTESGKVARLFMNLLLLRSGLPPSIIHSTERQRYYEALKGSATTVLSMVQESVENALSSVEKLLDEHETRTRAFVS